MIEQINSLKGGIQGKFAEDYTLNGLKLLIIAWCIFVIGLTLMVDNKWVLGAILAYEVLP